MTLAAESASLVKATVEVCSPIVDLRQYTLYPGTRDPFIELFDREFVETQEAEGIRIIGQFRDQSDPNRFVWMRGYPDMLSREKALTSFYMHGEAWRRYGEIARSHMIDSSDVLMLRPIRPDTAFTLPSAAERPSLNSGLSPGLVVAAIYSLPRPVDADFVEFFEESVQTALIGAGGRVLGVFATEDSPNNFARLPVREGENVFVLFLAFESLAGYHEYMTALGRHRTWRSEIYPALLKRLQRPPQILRLAPTSRSQLRP
jgi:hypothetical protein